ncbi:MAG: hypothetical protein ACLSDQ_07795 [Adlercreutzia equolifaciens]
MEEELAAGVSGIGGGRRIEHSPRLHPVPWTRKKIALAVVIGVVVARFPSDAAALYLHR